MKIDQIWTYPVKSMLGGRLQSAELASNGIVGDRLWALPYSSLWTASS